MTIAAAGEVACAANFYVAPNGNDHWSGRLPTPNATRSDGPLASLEGARDAVRRRKQAGPLPPGGVTVEVGGGTYPLKRPLLFTGRDSGTGRAPIVYRARHKQKVTLSGGQSIGDFVPVTDATVLARLDEGAHGHVLQADLGAQGVTDFGSLSPRGFDHALRAAGLELFFKGRPMTLARWPNEGFTTIADVPATGQIGYEGERPRRWAAEMDIWLHGYWSHDWADTHEKVSAIDTQKRLLTLAPPHHRYGYRKGQRFYALNLLAELDAPGEWYLDRDKALLYFWPPTKMQKGAVVVSLLQNLASFDGASHIALRGFTLEAARGAAIQITDGADNRIEGCTLRNIGSRAVEIRGGLRHGVAGCDIHETGDGGVLLSGGDRATLKPAGHYALDNHIHDFSRWSRTYRPAVQVEGVGNRVAHNLIHDAPHNAIQLDGNEHLIEFNEIHHVCEETGDVGAFYAGADWSARGNIIRHNFFHDIQGPGLHGAMGVYLDDQASGFTIYGNVFSRVTRAVFIGGGRDNTVENNVFFECNPAIHVDARGVTWQKHSLEGKGSLPENLGKVPYKSELWRARYPTLLRLFDDGPGLPKGNVIARNIAWRGRWAEIQDQARPYVTFRDNLLDTDPLFSDAARANSQLRDDSPAFKLNFQRIPIERIGLLHGPRRASKERKPQ